MLLSLRRVTLKLFYIGRRVTCATHALLLDFCRTRASSLSFLWHFYYILGRFFVLFEAEPHIGLALRSQSSCLHFRDYRYAPPHPWPESSEAFSQSSAFRSSLELCLAPGGSSSPSRSNSPVAVPERGSKLPFPLISDWLMGNGQWFPFDRHFPRLPPQEVMYHRPGSSGDWPLTLET